MHGRAYRSLYPSCVLRPVEAYHQVASVIRDHRYRACDEHMHGQADVGSMCVMQSAPMARGMSSACCRWHGLPSHDPQREILLTINHGRQARGGLLPSHAEHLRLPDQELLVADQFVDVECRDGITLPANADADRRLCEHVKAPSEPPLLKRNSPHTCPYQASSLLLLSLQSSSYLHRGHTDMHSTRGLLSRCGGYSSVVPAPAWTRMRRRRLSAARVVSCNDFASLFAEFIVHDASTLHYLFA